MKVGDWGLSNCESVGAGGSHVGTKEQKKGKTKCGVGTCEPDAVKAVMWGLSTYVRAGGSQSM